MRQFHLLFFIFLCLCSQSQVFDSPIIISGPPTASPYESECLDIDQDGDLDIITAGLSNITWFENQGDIGFGHNRIIGDDYTGYSDIELADIDQNGLLDILFTAVQDDVVGIHYNLGGGEFSLAEIVTQDLDGAICAIAADFDLDGDIDVAAGGRLIEQVYVYLNDGNEYFDDFVDIPGLQSDVRDIEVHDMNADGLMDLIVTNENVGGNSAFSVHLNNGEGQFAWGTSTIQFTTGGYDMEVADFNGDGLLDVAAAIYGEQDFVVRLRNADQPNLYLPQVTIGMERSGAADLHPVDLDGDGDLDLLTTSELDNQVIVYENDGSGDFENEFLLNNTTSRPREVSSADLDGDGDQDIIISGGSWSFTQGVTVGWMENLGNWEFGPLRNMASSVKNGSSARAGDINGDGNLDVVASSRESAQRTFFLGNDVADFGEEHLLSDEYRTAFVFELSDLDQDDDLDFVATSREDNLIYWVPNNGDGSFGEAITILENYVSPIGMNAGDIDNDGDEDYFPNTEAANGTIWFENLGNGALSPAQFVSPDESLGILDIGDIDNDGLMDIVGAEYGDEGSMYAFFNQGNGQFSLAELVQEEFTFITDVELADLNNDGFKDLVYTTWSQFALVWQANDGTGEFESPLVIDNLYHYRYLTTADYDLDGDLDIVATTQYSTSPALFYENLGNGDFAPRAPISTESGQYPYYVETAFLDDDARPDILGTHVSSDRVQWSRNRFGEGCTDVNACNYDPAASIDDGSCCFNDCGCTDPLAQNYDSLAICDNLSCEYSYGCLDPFATNFDPSATTDDGSCKYEVYGYTFSDANQNGTQDPGEVRVVGQEIELGPYGLLTESTTNGVFVFPDLQSGSYYTTVENNGLPIVTTFNPAIAFIGDTELDSIPIGLYFDDPAFSLESALYPNVLNGYPCDTLNRMQICITNTSNRAIDIDLVLSVDPQFQDIVEVSPWDNLDGNDVTFSLDGLGIGEVHCFQIDLLTPNASLLGATLSNSIVVDLYHDGQLVGTETNQIAFPLTCEESPVQKSVQPPGSGPLNYVQVGTELEYILRFQNVSDTIVQDVLIRDTISPDLDISTIQLQSYSHPCYFIVNTANREVQIWFQNIQLLDSGTNEVESHGFVSYSILHHEDLPLLTGITNTALISLDSLDLLTNSTLSTIFDCSAFDVEFISEGALLTATAGDSYQWYLDGEAIPDATEQTYVALVDGTYYVEVGIDFPCMGESEAMFILGSDLQDLGSDNITLFPNPMVQDAIIRVEQQDRPYRIRIYDAKGQLLRDEVQRSSSGQINLSRNALSKGSYLLEIKDSEETKRRLRFIVE